MIQNVEPSNGLKTSLSVVVPVTNMSGKLQNLKSWISEISPYDIQVILVHDFRDAETSEELKNLIFDYSKDKNIIITEGQFGSPGVARNIGLSLVKNEWVAFWDSDDLPQVDNVMKELFRSSDITLDCIVGNFRVNFVNSKRFKQKPLSDNYLDEIGLNPGVWRFLFRTSQLGATRFANLSMAEDQVFLANFFSRSRNIKVSNSLFYIYFVGLNTQLTQNSKAMKDLPIALELLSDVLRSGKGVERINFVLFTRIFFTTLKKSSLNCKLRAVRTWVSLYFKSDFSTKRNLIRAAELVIRNE